MKIVKKISEEGRAIKNEDKNIDDYKKEKIKLLEHKYSDFKLAEHPEVKNDPNIEYSDVAVNHRSVKLLY